MAEASVQVREFFERYAEAAQSTDTAFFGLAYGETFMFAGPGGAQAVKRDDFLKMLPRRKAFFAAVGLSGSRVRGIEEEVLDGLHLLVKVGWTFQFEKDQRSHALDDIAATYILRRQDNRLQIVFQLDHQDLTKRVQELGLLPAQE